MTGASTIPRWLRSARVGLRLVALLLLAVAAFGSFATTERTDAGAQTAGTVIFDLSARADGLGAQFVGSGLPVVPGGELFFLSPSSAQSTLNQFSGSAFASAPYPGDTIASLPSTVNGLGAGTLPPFPAYPFYVATDSSTGDKSEEVGPYRITAHTDADSSTADARIGASTGSPEVLSVTSKADVSRDPDTGILSSKATTRTAPLRINELISIGEIRSSATMTFDPSEPDTPPEKSSSVAVGTITIAGIELGLTDQGLSLAGQQLLPLDVSALTKLLGDAGIELDVIPAEESENSVTSAGVVMTFEEEFPAPLLETTVKVVLGRSSATLATSTVAPPPPVPDAPAVATPTPTPAPSGGSGSIGSGGSLPAPTPTGAAPTAPDATAPEVAAPVPASDATPASSEPLADFTTFYPVLAAGALLALTSSRLVQWLSFRLRLAPT